MGYVEDYHYLKKLDEAKLPAVPVEGSDLVLRRLPFGSPTQHIFPADKNAYAPYLNGTRLNLAESVFTNELEQLVQISDAEVAQNFAFEYLLLQPSTPKRARGSIFLFHGLNEKDWSKYLPWAKYLAQHTQKAVILFPLAFHLDRALNTWQNSRAMQTVSRRRAQLFAHITESSFSNAAMSTRLHFAPERFFYSGLATYIDIITLANAIRQDTHEFIAAEAGFDFVGFSAGAYLVQVLLMANRDALFSQSKGVLLAGGCLLSRMHLTSRYIMDNAAQRALLEFYTENFEQRVAADAHLQHLFNATQKGGIYFKSLLSEASAAANQLRRYRLGELHSQLLAIAPVADTVMPPAEVQASLLGLNGKPAIPLEEWEFEYAYSHVMPFPLIDRISDQVTRSFEQMMDRIVSFIG